MPKNDCGDLKNNPLFELTKEVVSVTRFCSVFFLQTRQLLKRLRARIIIKPKKPTDMAKSQLRINHFEILLLKSRCNVNLTSCKPKIWHAIKHAVTINEAKSQLSIYCNQLTVKTLTTNPLTARCPALSVKSCLCSNALLGVFAYVQWSHRDKFKQQIQR